MPSVDRKQTTTSYDIPLLPSGLTLTLLLTITRPPARTHARPPARPPARLQPEEALGNRGPGQSSAAKQKAGARRALGHWHGAG